MDTQTDKTPITYPGALIPLALIMPAPVAIKLADIEIYWYGVFVALGLLVGMVMMTYRSRHRTDIDAGDISNVVLAAMIGGIVGARLVYVATHWSTFSGGGLMEIVNIRKGGLVFYGGFAGAVLAVFATCRFFRLPIGIVADLTALGLPLGQAVGRVGCFINGCCFGNPTGGTWGILYPGLAGDRVFFIQSFVKNLLGADATGPLPVLPAQLFQSAINLGVFALLLAIATRMKRSGQLFALYMVFYGIGRFINEFSRGDYAKEWHGFTIAQLISIPVCLAGIALYRFLGERPEASEPAGRASGRDGDPQEGNDGAAV